jgi:hypothetical protein
MFGMGGQGRLRPRQLRIQFGHHMGQDSVVHLILHHAADRRKRLEHDENKYGTCGVEMPVEYCG